MDEIAGLTFRQPIWLWALAAIPLAGVFLFSSERLRRNLADRFAAEALRGVWNPARSARPWLLTAGLLFAVASYAGPRIGSRLVPVQQSRSSRIVAIDLSQSMAAEDVGSSRITAAKAVARKVLQVHEGRVGLVIFEDDAQIVSPLTSDTAAVAALVDSLGPGELQQPGSNLGRGITEALKLVDAAPLQSADVVLISDGENQGGALDLATDAARRKGVKISTIVIGTPAGARIPLAGQPYLRDNSGNEVISRSNPGLMAEIARRTGGRFFQNPFGEHSLDTLADQSEGSRGPDGRRLVRIPKDRFQWPLAASLFLLLLGSLAHRGAE